jgi:SAM-dependent methyltransferase
VTGRHSNIERPAGLRFELTARACPICGSADGDAFAEANIDVDSLGSFAFASRKLPEYMHHRLVLCRSCDLLYANPAPDPSFLDGAYRDAAFDASDESHYASRTYAAFLQKFIEHLPDRLGALDIGAGDGAFVEQLLRLGFENIVGVEPSAAPVALAKLETRPLLRQAPFHASDFALASLRLVTCFQTLEHVFDPLQLCKDSFALLKPGGALLMVCHDRDALLTRVLGLKSPIFDIEHLQLFSPRSIRSLFARAGFSRIEVHTIVNRYPINYWARVFPLPRRLKPLALRLVRASGLGAITLAAPVGNLAVIGYK